MDKEIEESELFLNQLNKEGGYTVPEGYFEQLQQKIQTDISKQKSLKKAKKIPLFWLSAAAIIVISLGVWLMPFSRPNTTEEVRLDNELMIDQLGSTELSADLLCDAGWCLELEQLPILGDSSLDYELLQNIETDFIIEEL
jgi:hypothetical protein